MAISENAISLWSDIFQQLIEVAAAAEDTRIIPNLEVIAAAPTDPALSGYIIVRNDQGFYGPVLKLPGYTYTNGDFVNVAILKGTEPIAMQQGSASGGSNAGRVYQVYNDTLADVIIETNTNGDVTVNPDQTDRDFTVNSDGVVGLVVVGSSGDVFFGGTVLGRLTDLDTFFDFSTADAIGIYGGGVELLRLIEDTQDLVQVNPGQLDVDFEVGANGLLAISSDGATGDVTFGAEAYLTGAAAPQSQATNGIINRAGFLLDGGHPMNTYPSSRDDDDAEFNNSTAGDNNTIGSIAGGDYWEWLANDPSGGSGSYSINTIRSHLSVKVARPDGDASLQADLATSVPASTEVLFTVCLRYLKPFTTTSDEYFAIRLLDVSTTNYYEVSYRNNGATVMSIQSHYIDGGARTQDGSTVALTEVPAALWLQWRQQSNTTYRAQISYDGLSFFTVQSAAKTFSNTFVADRIILIFGQSDSAALTNITYNIDSVRRT